MFYIASKGYNILQYLVDSLCLKYKGLFPEADTCLKGPFPDFKIVFLHLCNHQISTYSHKNLKSKILAYSNFALASCAQ